jgi:heme/copper-type cytochrome/quinol oxidase subunit 3
VLAHQAAEKGDGKKAARFLYMTIGGALIFLMVKSYEWTMEISHGYTITSNGFWSFYYTMAGLHAAHVIAGGIIMAIVAHDAARGRELQRVELIGIYWHFVDIVWIFLFPLLYIAK